MAAVHKSCDRGSGLSSLPASGSLCPYQNDSVLNKAHFFYPSLDPPLFTEDVLEKQATTLRPQDVDIFHQNIFAVMLSQIHIGFTHNIASPALENRLHTRAGLGTAFIPDDARQVILHQLIDKVRQGIRHHSHNRDRLRGKGKQKFHGIGSPDCLCHGGGQFPHHCIADENGQGTDYNVNLTSRIADGAFPRRSPVCACFEHLPGSNGICTKRPDFNFLSMGLPYLSDDGGPDAGTLSVYDRDANQESPSGTMSLE
jgi:hypothetical protein